VRRADLVGLGRDVLRPSSEGDIVAWLEANVRAIPDSPMPGPFRADRTPWVRDALRIAADPEVQLMTVLASIQSGKSLFARLLTCWIAEHAPGPTLLLQATDPEAKDFALRYLRPVFKNCPPVLARMKDDDMERSTTIDFDRFPLYCRGAWNEANLQRLSIRYIIGDECWLWPPGHLQEASARVTAFGWMGKRVFMTQGGTLGGKGGEFHALHDTTDQRDWNFRCPKCDHLQPWLWEFIRFPEEAKASGTWDLNAVADGTKYECAGCHALLDDNAGTRADANARGEFVATNPLAYHGKVGLHWNSLASMSWGELGVLMLKAKEAADVYGDNDGRRLFKQKRLAMPWQEEGGEIVADASASEYNLGDVWESEAYINGKGKVVDAKDAPTGSIPFRTMGVDVQRGHFWVVVRSWAKSGHSRLYAFGKVETWGGVEDMARKASVHKAMVFVDAGDQTSMVYAETARRGWKCARGSGNEDFAVTDRDGKTTRRFYSERQRIQVPGLNGQPAVLVSWSNLQGKDLMHGMRVKRLHTFPRNADPFYIEMMSAEVRVKDKRTGKPMWILPQGKKDNHAWDCELLCLLGAVRWGIGSRGESGPTEAVDAA